LEISIFMVTPSSTRLVKSLFPSLNRATFFNMLVVLLTIVVILLS
jgi:hypothetical protein